MGFLSFFAIIPLGIYFAGGLSTITGIPLNLINYNDIIVYSWGFINLSVPMFPVNIWWIEPGNNGLIPFICIQLMILLACIITIISANTKSENGRKGLVAAVIMILVSIVYVIIDILVLGDLVNIVIPSADILGSFGMGFYILIFSLIIGIISIKVHPNTISE